MFEDYFTTQPLDYDEFANQLYEEGDTRTPAYLHGGICGVLAGGQTESAEDVLAALDQALDTEIRGALAELSQRLVEATRSALSDDSFEFQLFLPDDEEPMPDRLRALGEWCAGFMAGYALAVADTGQDGLGEEVAEVLRDVAAIAEVDVDVDGEAGDDADGEESEHYYFEITEYLRFATLNLYLDALTARDEAG